MGKDTVPRYIVSLRGICKRTENQCFPRMVLSKVPCTVAISNPQNALCESQELTARLHLDQLSALRPNLHNFLAALL